MSQAGARPAGGRGSESEPQAGQLSSPGFDIISEPGPEERQGRARRDFTDLKALLQLTETVTPAL